MKEERKENMFPFKNKKISYVALGDSLTAGVGASLFSPTFPQRYRRKIECVWAERVDLYTIARSGLTVEEIATLSSHPRSLQSLAESEVITITAGGNNLIDAYEDVMKGKSLSSLQDQLKEAQRDFNGFIQSLLTLKKKSSTPYFILVATLYNPFPESQEANAWIQKVNAFIKKLNYYPHLHIVDLYSLFKGKEKEWLSRDGVHPNDKGYEAMARAFCEQTPLYQSR
jgi:lysophospholipase L1-like esterase